MSILLVNPPALSGVPGGVESFIAGQKRRLTPSQYYSLPIEHLGLMSIAAYARSSRIPVHTVNGMVSGHSSLEETWQAIRCLGRRDSPALIGFTNIDTFDEVCWLIARCRREWEDVRIVLGNTFATLNYEQILKSCPNIDYVIVGDGEVAFTLLAQALLDKHGIEAVPGLVWRDCRGTIQRNPMSVVDIDSLPWPSREELPAVLDAGFAAAVFTTRGCLYRCTFCGTGATSGLLGRDGYRLRAIDAVVDEIEYLVTDFGIKFIAVSDDLFLSKPARMQERAAEFASELLRRNLMIRFMVDARIDALTDLDLLAHLGRAGLRRVFVGLETGSYEQLVAYRKRQVLAGEDPAARIRAVQDLGIEVVPGMIMLHPTVQPSELRETLRLLKATGYQTPYKLLERMVAYPGTPLYRDYAAKGFLTQSWPLGEWQFADNLAERFYHRVSEYIRSNDVTFADAEKFFLSELAEWERQAAMSVRDGGG
jgi:radical SAM superfamily enzyme YgiQ (UPF0313 family)